MGIFFKRGFITVVVWKVATDKLILERENKENYDPHER